MQTPFHHRIRDFVWSGVLLAAIITTVTIARAHGQSPAVPVLPTSPSPPITRQVRDLYSDTWVGTDSLGRTLPTSAATRHPRKDRFVGIFYFITHGSDDYYTAKSPLDYSFYGSDPRTLRDSTQIIKTVGGDPVDKPEAWPNGEYWWGQPAVGYFLSDDVWVARHDLQMLAAAGVDTLIFDVTNGPQYDKAIATVLGTAEQMRREGLATPKFCFITYSGTGIVAADLYRKIYSKGLYKDLWFYWDGKPLIFGWGGFPIPADAPANSQPPPEVVNFFTWRHSWANNKGPYGNGKDEWEWSDSGDPQMFGWHDDPKQPEEAAVLAAGWASSDLGRSFQGGDQPWGRKGHEPPINKEYVAADVDRGLFFAQQWKDALAIDPQFLWVTGWNEWTAGRQYGPGIPMLGRVTKPGQYFFVDEFNEEFSRDAMPMQGGFKDNYYMQLIDGIRRYKGVRPIPIAHAFRTMTGDMSQWLTVMPEYRDAAGDTAHRNHYGWANVRYVDTSGRNDIITAKVACDVNNVYFYVQTQAPMTPWNGSQWMQLLIDADHNPKTGWMGYDYVVNQRVLNAHTTTLTRFSDGKTWKVSYRMAGTQMQVTIPRRLLGLINLHKAMFDFHWVDHVKVGPGGADPATWWYVGDSAPDGRFNYRCINAGP